MSLREYLDVIVEGRWIVAAAVALAIAVGAAYAFLATPTYRTDALVQVEDKKGGNSFLSELSGAFGESSPAETEIEILRSRAMLGAVVRELRLDIVAAPRRFPLVGGAIARRHKGRDVAGPFLGRAFGWGGERVRVDRLEVPEELVGEHLTLVAHESGRFTVAVDGEPLLDGEVGKPAAGRGVEVFVSELHARPGLEFTLLRRRHDDVVEDLQKEVRIAEKGKKTGVLQLTFEGESARGIAAILDALSRAYLLQNVERRSAEAEKTLVIPADADAGACGRASTPPRPSWRATGRGAGAWTSPSRPRRRSPARSRSRRAWRSSASSRPRCASGSPSHTPRTPPSRRRRAASRRSARRSRRVCASSLEAELESARRMRDVKVANELYLAVLNKVQELRVVKEGTIGNVRILDAAVVPVRPVAPEESGDPVARPPPRYRSRSRGGVRTPRVRGGRRGSRGGRARDVGARERQRPPQRRTGRRRAQGTR